ncbi:MAG: LA_2272 family surface repeat-containing protein [Fibrobacterota bacterium]
MKYPEVSLLLILFFGCASLWGETILPVQLSFSPGRALFSQKAAVRGLSFSVTGAANEVYGLEFGLPGITRNRGDVLGVSLSALYNSPGAVVIRGVQGAPINFSRDWHHPYGVRGLGVGVLNLGGHGRGVRIAAVNMITTQEGVQIGGMNLFSPWHGIQIGGVNLISRDGRGLQLGVVNTTRRAAGVQVGLVNYARTMRGIQIGLLNISGEEGGRKVFPLFLLH